MNSVKRISISGFRGINSELTIEFYQNNKPSSVIIFGENGTGKSSLTDSWEWFCTKRIEHLAREDAKDSSYPHLLAKDGSTYIEVEFGDQSLGLIRLQYDRNRITQPKPIGKYADFLNRFRHASHLRFSDLTRFVYLTKADRFDILASLMGFTPQVDYQKALRRVEAKLFGEVESLSKVIEEFEKGVSRDIGTQEVNTSVIHTKLAGFLTEVGFKCEPAPKDVHDKLGELQLEIEKDPTSKRLACLIAIQEQFAKIDFPNVLSNQLNSYAEKIVPLKEKESEIGRIVFLGLYTAGEKAILQSERRDYCPLCERGGFGGDLLEHIHAHLESLKPLQETINFLEKAQNALIDEFEKYKELEVTIQTMKETSSWVDSQLDESVLPVSSKEVDAIVSQAKTLSQVVLTEVDYSIVTGMKVCTEQLKKLNEQWSQEKNKAVEFLNAQIEAIKADKKGAQLVETHAKVKTLLDKWSEITSKKQYLHALSSVSGLFGKRVDSYVQASISDVNSKFERISENVKRYFHILEEGAVGIGAPALRLLEGHDRAAVLEIEFHGAKKIFFI